MDAHDRAHKRGTSISFTLDFGHSFSPSHRPLPSSNLSICRYFFHHFFNNKHKIYTTSIVQVLYKNLPQHLETGNKRIGRVEKIEILNFNVRYEIEVFYLFRTALRDDWHQTHLSNTRPIVDLMSL